MLPVILGIFSFGIRAPGQYDFKEILNNFDVFNEEASEAIHVVFDTMYLQIFSFDSFGAGGNNLRDLLNTIDPSNS